MTELIDKDIELQSSQKNEPLLDEEEPRRQNTINHPEGTESISESILTEDLKKISKKVEERVEQDKPLLPHRQGYIFGFHYYLEKISVFRVGLFWLNGYICGWILLIMLTFHRGLPTDFYISISLLSVLVNILLIVDSYYLIYYKRYPRWIYYFNALEILFWVITYLNFSETWPFVYKTLTHLVYISNPLIYAGSLVYCCLQHNSPNVKIIMYYSHVIRIIWNFYRTIVLMKIMDIGLAGVKTWILLLPLTAYLVVMLAFSIVVICVYLFQLICCCRGGGTNHYERAINEVAFVSFPICAFLFYFFLKVNSFFEYGEQSFLVLISFWILMIITGIGYFWKTLEALRNI